MTVYEARDKVRYAARVVLLDQADQVLLLRVGPHGKATRARWITPGGAVEDGETVEQAACRELQEETGIRLVDLGPIVFRHSVALDSTGQAAVLDYFIVRVENFTPRRDRWTELEQSVIEDVRWWPIDELRSTTELIYPDELLSLITAFTDRRPAS